MFVCNCRYDSGNEIGSIHEPGCPALGVAGAQDLLAEEEVEVEVEVDDKIRTFETGATRDADEGKLDFEGFFSPGVMYRFAQYMHDNRVQSDGNLRDSDNWQRGIPREQYMKSMYRHFMEVWAMHRVVLAPMDQDGVEDALCALMFNVMGYMFELQQGR